MYLLWCWLLMLPSAVALPAHDTSKASSNPAAPLIDGNTLASTGKGESVGKVHLGITLPISLAILGGGVLYIVWIFRLKKRQLDKQDFIWLMTLMASLAWGAIAAITALPNDGSVLSISSWLALYAVYIAKNYRGLRNGNQYLFTSLLGGLAITSTTTLVAMLAWKDGSRGMSTSTEAFARQALTVGPTVTTLWSWIVLFVFRELEQQPFNGTQDGNELANMPTEQDPVNDV
jgi:lysylphosphatidylglycerol synthetase-like protein (DUF2156 family)